MAITNDKLTDYQFLAGMYRDGYFPDFLVDKGKAILIGLCEQIESQKPSSLEALYVLTHAATKAFNDLQEEFEDNESEIETAARDCIGMDFAFIAKAYGFDDADGEELIATRDW
ncbi:MAG: DUF5713 family protein [bacterium]|nr:DUF5713 family protein [bacterium]